MNYQKLNKFNYYILSVALAGILTGCGMGKMVKKYADVTEKVTPSPLEAHAGKVPVKISVNYPEKYFHKKAMVEVQPYLVWDGGELALKTKKLKGEAAEGEAEVISYDGGSVTYTDTVPYQVAMKNCKLQVRATASLGSKTQELGSKDLAEGTIITSTRAMKKADFLIGEDAYEKVTVLEEDATIYFQIQQANVRTSEKRSEQVKNLQDFVKKGYKAHGVEITSYASPDGPVDLNEKLAKKRDANTYTYLSRELKRLGFEGALADTMYSKKQISEDWAGLQKILAASDVEDKELILKILNSYTDPVDREKEIKNLADAYDDLKGDVLPKLRRSEMKVKVLEPKHPDSLIIEYAQNNPDTLKKEELLFAGTLTEDWDIKHQIYKTYSEKYADDWRGFNNVAWVEVEKGNVEAAAAMIEKASSIAPDNARLINNEGVIALLEGNYKIAREKFNKAKSMGVDASNNLGVLFLMTADYTKSKEFFGDKCSYNNGLVNVLLANYAEAEKFINCDEMAKETAEAFYLKAIVGARTSNKEMLINNLKTAVSKNTAYKTDAKTDLEFKKYWEDTDFKGAVQ